MVGNVAGDLAEYNGRYKIEMRVGAKRSRILKETQLQVHNRVPFTVCTAISMSAGHVVLEDTIDFLTGDVVKFTGCKVQVTEQ